MPSYCPNCGSSVSGPFCGNCGQKLQPSITPAQPPPPPVTPAATTAPAPLSSSRKPLLLGCAIVVVLFAAGIAGTVYGFYWFKNKAMAKVASYSGGMVGSQAEVRVTHGNTCSLLSRDELQQLLGVTIEKTVEIMEGSAPGCAYYTNPAGFEQLRNLAIEQARKEAEAAKNQPASKSDNPLTLLKDVNQLEGVVKALSLSQGGDKEGRAFAFTVNRAFGRGNWTTFRATTALVPGFQEVQGLGDHAMVGSFGHVLHVLQGDNLISLELTWVPDARTRGADIARKIASHL